MKPVKLRRVIPLLVASIALSLLAVSAFMVHSSVYAAPVSNSGLKIMVTPTSVLPNGTLTVTGTGFTPNGNVFVATSAFLFAHPVADGIGDITTTIQAPFLPGTYHLLAIDSTTSKTVSVNYQVIGPVTMNPKIKVAPTSIVPGGTLTVTGTGFTPGGFVVVITGNSSTSITAADAYGNISATIGAPSIPNPYVVAAIDGFTQAHASAKYTVI